MAVYDAPASAQADVEFVISTDTDVAIDSADWIPVKGELNGIVKVRRQNWAAVGNIRRKCSLPLYYNAAGVPFAASVLYTPFGIQIGPIFTASAISTTSLSVVSNALSLRTINL